MKSLENLMREAAKVSESQRKELLAMAKGMKAANEIRKKEEQKEKK